MVGTLVSAAVMLLVAIAASAWVAADGGEESTGTQSVAFLVLLVLWGIVAWLGLSIVIGLSGD